MYFRFLLFKFAVNMINRGWMKKVDRHFYLYRLYLLSDSFVTCKKAFRIKLPLKWGTVHVCMLINTSDIGRSKCNFRNFVRKKFWLNDGHHFPPWISRKCNFYSKCDMIEFIYAARQLAQSIWLWYLKNCRIFL